MPTDVVSSAVQFPHWHPHFDAWLLLGGLELLYLLAIRREGRRRGPTKPSPASRRDILLFSAGVGVLLLASDWPIHDVAEGYLYSVHMIQHLLMTLVAAALLVAGTPGWMAEKVVRHRLVPVVRWLARPVPALFQFNLVLVLSHWPAVVEATVRHHALHFVAHGVLLASAVLMWLPVASRHPAVPRFTAPMQMLYLFLQTVVPTVPASFLTFGKTPLYRIYESFPRLWGISALADQQTAGLIMKLAGGFFLWTVIAVIFFRWYAREEERSGVLMWDDVERELRKLDGAPARPEGT